MPLKRNLLHFARVKGKSLEDRVKPFYDYVEARRDENVQPFGRSLLTEAKEHVRMRSDRGEVFPQTFLNFGSQDYLGLANDSRIHEAAKQSIDNFGSHSGGTPLGLGRQTLSLELENRLSELLGREACTLFATGWTAGFSVLAGLVQKHDTVILDSLAHNCLQVGAQYSTSNLHLFRHNDPKSLEEKLKLARESNSDEAVFVVFESLYSMDSDSPDLAELLAISESYQAITVIDVSHDLGAMGDQGFGLLEKITFSQKPDLIMGSLSKALGANGGFIVSSKPVRDYLFYHCQALMFSSNISPVQCGVVLKYLDIAFSSEGHALRKQMMDNVMTLRSAFTSHGLNVIGEPSPIVPVLIGSETLSRLASRLLEENGLLVNLIEFPAVPIGKSRFRFQVRPQHDKQDLLKAAKITADCLKEASEQATLLKGLA